MQAAEQMIADISSMQWRKASDCYNTHSEQAILEINHPLVFARATLQGGQLLECELSGRKILWLSPTAIFDGSKAIRGGIPVCLPWFGVHQTDPTLPKHGFVRNADWVLQAAEANDEHVTLAFHFRSDGHEHFEHAFSATLHYTFTATALTATLTLENHSATRADFSYALHSYLAVSNSLETTVTGLEGKQYLDNLEGFAEKEQAEAISFTQEVDRVYLQSGTRQTVESTHRLHIDSNDMPSTVVWNPNTSALDVADIGEAYNQYVCVERGAVLDDAVTLAPHASASTSMTLSIG